MASNELIAVANIAKDMQTAKKAELALKKETLLKKKLQEHMNPVDNDGLIKQLDGYLSTIPTRMQEEIDHAEEKHSRYVSLRLNRIEQIQKEIESHRKLIDSSIETIRQKWQANQARLEKNKEARITALTPTYTKAELKKQVELEIIGEQQSANIAAAVAANAQKVAQMDAKIKATAAKMEQEEKQKQLVAEAEAFEKAKQQTEAENAARRERERAKAEEAAKIEKLKKAKKIIVDETDPDLIIDPEEDEMTEEDRMAIEEAKKRMLAEAKPLPPPIKKTVQIVEPVVTKEDSDVECDMPEHKAAYDAAKAAYKLACAQLSAATPIKKPSAAVPTVEEAEAWLQTIIERKGGGSLISGSVVERLKAGTAVTATESVEDRPRVLTNTKLRKKMVGVLNRPVA